MSPNFADRPVLEPFDPASGFTVRYPVASPEVVGMVRGYQSQLRQQSPDWMSQVEFDPHGRGMLLYVFPVSSLPAAVLGRRSRRRYGQE